MPRSPSILINRVLRFASFSLIIARSIAMQASRGDGGGGKGIVLLPKSGTYSKVVFWFHGLGDTADGWSGLMPELKVDDCKFILPTAPERPITINGGYEMPGWSDIFGLDMEAAEDKAGFGESAARVEALIKLEMDKGIASNKILLGGFSQGGALALHISLRSPLTLAGCVALSSWLPLRKDFPAALSPAAKTLPIFQVHGNADQVVNYAWGKNSHELIKTMITAPAPKFMTIPGMGHSSHPDEIDAVKVFANEQLDKST